MSETQRLAEGRCFYESCGHALAVAHNCETDELLCDYHADGEKICDSIYILKLALLLSSHHGFSGTLDALDLEENEIRALYGMSGEQ